MNVIAETLQEERKQEHLEARREEQESLRSEERETLQEERKQEQLEAAAERRQELATPPLANEPLAKVLVFNDELGTREFAWDEDMVTLTL